jgi:hypothetical protein
MILKKTVLTAVTLLLAASVLRAKRRVPEIVTWAGPVAYAPGSDMNGACGARKCPNSSARSAGYAL